MKNILRFSLLSATAAIIGTGAAHADDQQLKNRIDVQRAEAQRNQQATTIGVYVHGRGLQRETAMSASERSHLKLVRRNSPNGPDTFHYVHK